MALLVTTQLHLRTERGARIPWLSLAGFELAYWYVWAFLTPWVFWLSRRIPVERERFVSKLVIHGVLGTVISLAMIAYFAWLVTVFEKQRSFEQNFQLYLGRGFHYDVLIYWALVGIGSALSYHRMFREKATQAARLELRSTRLEASLIEARWQALRVQIQPHFLFNCLHAVAALMESNVSAAREMLARLGELLRMTLECPERVTLREEMELVDCYLDLEQTRLQDRLVVERQIEAEAWNQALPSLILQPLIENAIRHGVSQRSADGSLRIVAKVDGDRMSIDVIDNGPGLAVAPGPPDGIGLANVRARLRLWGEGADLHLRNRAEGGCRATLRFPVGRALPGNEPR